MLWPDAVRRECEDEPTGKRRAPTEAQRSQPPAREAPGREEREQDEQVVRPDVAQQPVERPVGRSEQPALDVRRRLRLGPERVRVGPWCGAALELVPDEPERPAELEVVAGGRLAVTGRRSREVVVVGVAHRRARSSDERGRDVEG